MDLPAEINLEEPCAIVGGICLPVEECPTGQLNSTRGLCPQQQEAGVECCHGRTLRHNLHQIHESQDVNASVSLIARSVGLNSERVQGRDFSLRYHSVQTGSGSTQPPIRWVPGALSPGLKRPDHKHFHLALSSVQIKNKRNLTSTFQFIFMAWCLSTRTNVMM
jgi:hypothetical protein